MPLTRIAIPAPIPLAPPVTTATLPSSVNNDSVSPDSVIRCLPGFYGSRAGCEIRFIVSDRSASGWADSPPARPAAGLQGRSRAAASSLFPRARRPSPPRARPGPTADSRLRQCRGRRSVRGRSRHRVPQRRVTNVEVSSTSCLTRGTKPASAHIAVRTLFMTERPCPKMGSGLLGRQS